MSTASQVESFCESCGTRYAFEPRRTAKRHLVKVGRLVGILPDEPDVDDSALVVSKDPFHGAFHFCLECRRFTCPTCWDAAAGFCRSCAAVLGGGDGQSEAEYALDAETQALLRAAFEDLERLGSAESWLYLEPPPEARPEHAVPATEFGEAPEDDLGHIIEAGVVARAAREAQAAREAADAAEREQARLEEERREQAEADRVAAEQAEAQRLAWEEYERQRQQYEADLVAWEAAEAQRLADEEAQRAAALEAERAAAQAEAERVAALAAQQAGEAGALAATGEHSPPDDVPAGQPGADLAAAESERLAAERAEAERLAAERAESERLAAERAESERLAADRAEAERLAAERAEAERLAAEDTVWETLAGALGPDVAADESVVTPTPERPQLPPPPQVPPPNAAWQVSGSPAGMPGWVSPPPPPGFRPPAPGWNAAPRGANGHGQGGDGHLRSGIRPCPRCDLALSANARFCRRCGLPQG